MGVSLSFDVRAYYRITCNVAILDPQVAKASGVRCFDLIPQQITDPGPGTEVAFRFWLGKNLEH
jgi:hypothetical protein